MNIEILDNAGMERVNEALDRIEKGENFDLEKVKPQIEIIRQHIAKLYWDAGWSVPGLSIFTPKEILQLSCLMGKIDPIPLKYLVKDLN